jgi:mRNA interferase RelE/StbE
LGEGQGGPRALKARYLRKIHRPDQERIREKIDALANDPRPPGVTALHGQPYLRLRVGDYRVLYEVQDKVLLVLVIRVAHRREVYRSK